QDINTMEKKQFEIPEVKVVETRPRSIIAQSPCSEDGCSSDDCTTFSGCTYVTCLYYEVAE
ncbi:MAG: hypothetical protein MJY80_07980, partial [Bacteroidales bacterium]|nr:hypothetical protein [Bacteroidales bacterium]